LFDLFEDAQSALHYKTKFPARSTGDGMHQRGAVEHQATCPVHHVGDQGPRRRCVLAVDQGIMGTEVARAVAGRYVEAAAAGVDAQVLPEVRELERSADRVRPAQGLDVVDAVQVQQ